MENIFQFIQGRIDRYSYKQLEKLADDTGVPYGTLMKIKARQTDNPRIKTVQPLLNFFKRKKATHSDPASP